MDSPDTVTSWRVHTRQEVAELLRVPLNQVDAAIRRGDLPVVRIGKHIRITDRALRAFVGLAAA